MEWLGTQIKVDPPRRPKKMTGTRFASVLGLNPWSTPFEMWCEITRTYEKPFEDTIYTIAGKTIEPKQAEYLKNAYMMDGLVTPTDVFGADYFNKTRGDFFPGNKIFGGMWDYLVTDNEGEVKAVIEMKTTKRVEDWEDDIPKYYALQAALYATLLGVDKVIMCCSFLEDKDYQNPEAFVPSPQNTITRPFSVKERYGDFVMDYLRKAELWWEQHVETGLSPEYDEKKDADILKVLRTNNVNPESDLTALIKEAEELKAKIDRHSAEITSEEKRYKTVVDMIKQIGVSQFRDGDKKVVLHGSSYTWEISKSSSQKINKEAMQEDGILDKYIYTEDSYRISPKAMKGDK